MQSRHETRFGGPLQRDLRARSQVETPALILDLDALERNVQRMAELARAAGVALRPHVKSHKSANIARIQHQAGAVGFCCATIGEAEMMARAGFTELLVTSPLVTDDKIDRLLALVRNDRRVSVVVDNPANAARLADRAQADRLCVTVLVDVDPGMHRTGAATQRAAIDLVRAVTARDSLAYDGLQCYAGQVQHVSGSAARQEATLSVLGALRVLCEELRMAGLAPRIVSGGGTGTHAIDAGAGVLTELQVGSYVVMDNQYNEVWTAAGEAPPFEVALFVQAAVVSNNHPGHVTCDAGFKHFAVDGGVPVIATGPVGGRYDYFGDVHGRVSVPPGRAAPGLGDRIEFVVPHCDPTINLFNAYHCVRGERLVDVWPVDARGV